MQLSKLEIKQLPEWKMRRLCWKVSWKSQSIFERITKVDYLVRLHHLTHRVQLAILDLQEWGSEDIDTKLHIKGRATIDSLNL